MARPLSPPAGLAALISLLSTLPYVAVAQPRAENEAPAGAATIWAAAEAGDVAAIRAALAAGVDVDGEDAATGQTPLLRAVAAGRTNAVKALLDAGADPSRPSRKGYPPLAFAAERGHLEIIRLLVKAGADPDAAPPPSYVPLAHAALEDKPEAMKLLIELGANVDAKNQAGLTALFSAAVRGRREAVKLLLAAGADVHRRNNDGFSPLMSAAHGGDVEALKLLIGAGADPADTAGSQSAVCMAAKAGRRDAVLFLLDRGADVNVESNFEDSLLSIVCGKGDADLARELLKRGAKAEPSDSGLEKALLGGHAECAQIMLDQGGTLTVAQQKEVAAKVLDAGHLDAAVLLFRARRKWDGGDPGPRQQREDALIDAARTGDVLKLKSAIDGGIADADITALTLKLAESARNKEAIDLLRPLATRTAKAAADMEAVVERLTKAAGKGDLKQVKALLDAGADGDAHDADSGVGPIHEAAEKGHLDVAKLLIERGAKLNACRGFVAATPLKQAAGAGKAEMVKLLLESGADPNAPSGHFSPLGSAAFNGHIEVVKILLDAGADIDYAGNVQGRTAVMWAAERGHNDVVELLAVEGADLTLKDDDGATAIAVAEAVANQEAADTLRVVGGTVGEPATVPITTLFGKGPAGVKRWLDRGGDPNAFDPQLKSTPLDYAVTGPLREPNRTAITRLLLENGADATGKGLLTSAVYSGRDVEFLKLLVEHGADVNGKGWRRGYTPLLIAAERGTAEQVKYLLSQGADLKARLDSGEDALALATKAKNAAAVALLKEANAPAASKSPPRK